MHYKDSTGFTYLTQTFLFCTCIPALHDCSGCGLKDFGCWQPTKCMIFLFFFKLLYIIHKASGWYRKCSTCIEVTLGIKHGVQFGKQITAKVNRSLKYLFFFSSFCSQILPTQCCFWLKCLEKCLHHTQKNKLFNLKVFICLIRNVKTEWRLVYQEITLCCGEDMHWESSVCCVQYLTTPFVIMNSW